MLRNLKQRIFPFLIAITALAVSGSAAFYSVSGLAKLFAGASLAVLIMASSLEVAKLVTASLLYQYWNKLNKVLRFYLTTSVVILMIITSLGIYGFLSGAYQDTYKDLVINENKIEFLKQKELFFSEDIERYNKEILTVNDNISKLSNVRSTTIQIKDTSSSTGIRNTISTVDLKLAQERINIEEKNRETLNNKRNQLIDSSQFYKTKILELENTSESVSELGPLKYISGLINKPMDEVINILLLIIIFVFDPLAISLVIAANFAFKQLGTPSVASQPVVFNNNYRPSGRKLTNEEIKKLEDKRDAILKKAIIKSKTPIEENLDKVGDPKIKEKYEDLDIIEAPKRPIDDFSDINVENKLKSLQSKLEETPSSKRKKDISNKIQDITKERPSDDLTITY